MFAIHLVHGMHPEMFETKVMSLYYYVCKRFFDLCKYFNSRCMNSFIVHSILFIDCKQTVITGLVFFTQEWEYFTGLLVSESVFKRQVGL